MSQTLRQWRRAGYGSTLIGSLIVLVFLFPVFWMVSTSLKAGNEVRLVGFGSFVPVKRAAGVARNPRTGEKVKRPASQTCRFRVGDSLKSTLNS